MRTVTPIPLSDAMQQIQNGMTGIIGSFSSRIDPPDQLLKGLQNSGLKDLTLIVLAVSNDHDPIGKMIEKGMVKKLIIGFNNANGALTHAVQRGEVELEFVPYGTLVEKVRLGGGGIPAFLSPVGADTLYSENREVHTLDGEKCILERTLTADFSLIRAAEMDAYGNLRYWHSAQHMNHYAAMASRYTVVQTDAVCAELSIENINTSGIFIQNAVLEPRHQMQS